jgi:hypothetical protein
MKTVRTPKRWLVKLTEFTVAAALVLSQRAVFAQEAPFTFGRTQQGTSPSGSASGVVDSNRQGFGMTFRAGHIAGDTVGRSESISHIGLMPYINIEDGLVFGDSRLVRGNDGGLVWSFGSGYRHYIADWDVVLGGNGYFDRDELTGAHLKQWGVGAELLANRWEARGNYYETFGDVAPQLTGSRVDQNSVAFVNNNISYTRIDTFSEGLHGWDSEIGFLLPGDISERLDLRAFGGGYYYEGDNVDGFAGWSSRLQADIAKWLELGLKVTDDEVYRTTLSFSVAVHFGGFRSEEHTTRSSIQRLGDPVRRNMNVVALTADIADPGELATNPNTGLPFTVAHVNSNNVTPPFAGTVDDPYRSLQTGLASGSDIVFTHAGSQWNALPDNIVSLGTGQQLLGEGLITSPAGNRVVVNTINVGPLGPLVLPSSPTFIASNFTLPRPILQNSAGNAVTLADDTQLSGFILDSPTGSGIFSNGAQDTIINDVLIQNAGVSGIRLLNTAGSTSITNTIIQASAGPAFHVSGGAGSIGFTATSTNLDPAFGAIFNASQEAVLIENMTGGSVNMTSTTIDDNGGAGIVIRNNAGNATIDNASITNSTATGVSVLNSSGLYTFRDTLRTAMTIDNPANEGILIDGLAATGRVSFENLSILNRQDAGVRVLNNAGQVLFGGQSAVIDIPAGGVAPGFAVNGSLATGIVAVANSSSLTVNGSNGRGVELTNNAAGSSFVVNGPLTITNAATESLAIVDDNSRVLMTRGTTINQRRGTGILIQNSNGSIGFSGPTAIDNPNAVVQNAVSISNSQAPISFAALGVVNATGNPAVSLVNNIAGANGNALISVGNLSITSVAGEGLFADNNSNIRVSDGTITSQGAAAVNVEDSGINMSFASINSTGSPAFGIRLVNTNQPAGWNQFKVTGGITLPTIGTGGTIQTAGNAGVFLQNAGQVKLQSMILDDNQNAVVVQNSGITTTDDQYLELFLSRISRSNVRGIYSLNLTKLDVRDSVFDLNGDDAALGRETVFAEYTERPNADTTERIDDYDNPYKVHMFRNAIIDNTTDAIVIGNQSVANGAHLEVDLRNNNLTVADLTDPTAPLDPTFPINTFDTDRVRDDAIVVRWNGPSFLNFQTNTISLPGTGPQTAFDIISSSGTDIMDLNMQSNQVDAVVVGIPTGQQVGLLLRTFGPSFSNIDANDFRFTGGEGRGMDFGLANETSMAITNNTIIDNTDGGAGIIFTTVAQPSSFIISGNTIGLFDSGTGPEEGIRFSSVAGVVNLFGTQNNIVTLLNPNAPGAFIESIFFMPAGSNNGRIIVNGALVP